MDSQISAPQPDKQSQAICSETFIVPGDSCSHVNFGLLEFRKAFSVRCLEETSDYPTIHLNNCAGNVACLFGS